MVSSFLLTSSRRSETPCPLNFYTNNICVWK
jgi:hypothetical protein